MASRTLAALLWTEGTTYRGFRLSIGPWATDWLHLDPSQRAGRIATRLPDVRGWRLSLGPLAVQAVDTRSFGESSGAMA